MFYKRNYINIITEALKFFPVLVLTGARQSGKTTLLKTLFPQYNYISLDLPSLAEQAEKNPKEFFADNPFPLIIDEVQYAPELFRHLKSIVDEDRHNMGSYILTGSQKFTLMKEVSESLAGRARILEMENLSLDEIRKDRSDSDDSIENIVSRGQYPELWRVPDFPSRDFYSSYLATYLERDVRQILNVASLRDFERFIRVLAPRNGQILNKSEVARDTGVSVKAVGDWLSVLQASNQVSLLEPWFHNFSKRLIKSPKVYFNDSGLLCFLLGISKQTLSQSPFKGMIWETFLYGELRKRITHQACACTLWYYRDSPAREVDFLLEGNGGISFIEVKWKEEPSSGDGKVIEELDRELVEHSGPYKPLHHYIIGRPHNSYPLTENISVIGPENLQQPLYQFTS